MPKSNVLPKGNFGLDVKIELSAKKFRLRRPPRPPKSMLEPAKARRASPSFLPEVSVGMENRESWYASTPCFWHSTLIFGGRGGRIARFKVLQSFILRRSASFGSELCAQDSRLLYHNPHIEALSDRLCIRI